MQLRRGIEKKKKDSRGVEKKNKSKKEGKRERTGSMGRRDCVVFFLSCLTETRQQTFENIDIILSYIVSSLPCLTISQMVQFPTPQSPEYIMS